MSPDEPIKLPICGICGQPMTSAHSEHVDKSGAGKRVDYVVVGKRGGIAEFREAGTDSKIRKTDAAALAHQLGIEQLSLLGRRFSCWVELAEYGIVRSDFKLIEDS